MSYQNMIPTFTESLSYAEKKKVDTKLAELQRFNPRL